MPYDVEIKELQDAATAASLNYGIWWIFRGEETRPKYVDVMNRYLGYFHVAIVAHFSAMLLALYRLYETRTDTYNIPKLIDRVESDDALSKIDADLLRQQFTTIKPSWVKVSILRNKVYGHREVDMTVEEIFNEAGITPFEFRELISKTKTLLNELDLKLRNSMHAFNLSATRDTIRILDSLKGL
ncbi:MAG: hypothetical protein Q8L95_04590 [Burkholderiales bacterium]|nr:hypothetical protein [Burkholderiales bacterium]